MIFSRAQIRVFLESEGFLVFSTCDAQCASEIVFCARDVDVMLVDQNSLGARAMELASELSKTRPNTFVIMLTGRLTHAEAFEINHLNGWKALGQPVPPAILLGVIRHGVAHQKRQPIGGNSHSREKAKGLYISAGGFAHAFTDFQSQDGMSLQLVRRDGEA
jgi:DNA-binding NtrC family response regulator